MGNLYISRGDAEALKSIELRELERLVDEAVWQSRSGDLHSLRLASCGPFVSQRLYRLDQAIIVHNKAKAAKKRAETAHDVRRAGMELVSAVRDMKSRLEEEEREQQLLWIDDVIWTPTRFTPNLSVRINYRWRATAEGDWTHGSITFLHEVDLRPDYTSSAPARKPTRAKQDDELQEKLYRVWEHLRSSALQSVREYLKSGQDRTLIPEAFQATTDSYSRHLNNYSTQFWRGTTGPASV